MVEPGWPPPRQPLTRQGTLHPITLGIGRLDLALVSKATEIGKSHEKRVRDAGAIELKRGEGHTGTWRAGSRDAYGQLGNWSRGRVVDWWGNGETRKRGYGARGAKRMAHSAKGWGQETE